MPFIIHNPCKGSTLQSISMFDPYSIFLNVIEPFECSDEGPLTKGLCREGVVLVTTKPRTSALALQELYTHEIGEKEVLFLLKMLKKANLISADHVFVTALMGKVLELRVGVLRNHPGIKSLHPILKKMQQKKILEPLDLQALKKEPLTKKFLQDFPQFFSQLRLSLKYSFYNIKPVRAFVTEYAELKGKFI